jgi:hypothetical protein
MKCLNHCSNLNALSTLFLPYWSLLQVVPLMSLVSRQVFALRMKKTCSWWSPKLRRQWLLSCCRHVQLVMVSVPCLEPLFWKMISTTPSLRTSMGLSMFIKSLRLVLDNLVPLCISVINVPNSLSFFSLFPTSKVPYKLSLS